MQPRPSTLKGKALQLLAARDHSRAELQAKLLHWLRAQTAKENEANRHPAVDESDDSPDFNAITEAAAQQHQQQVTAALDELQAKGFLNDQRTAEALLHRQADRLGAARLRHELQRKGIDESISADLLQDLADNEQERAFALWQKKFGTPPATPAERARHMRFLASRGFSGEVVHKVLRQAQAHPDAENAKR